MDKRITTIWALRIGLSAALVSYSPGPGFVSLIVFALFASALGDVPVRWRLAIFGPLAFTAWLGVQRWTDVYDGPVGSLLYIATLMTVFSLRMPELERREKRPEADSYRVVPFEKSDTRFWWNDAHRTYEDDSDVIDVEAHEVRHD